MSRRTDGLGATNTTFSNNLLVGGSYAAKIEGPYPGATWSANLDFNIPNRGDLPADGSTTADPQLAPGKDGLQRPQPGSPAIASAVGDFPMVTVDLDGQPRPEKKSRGAEESSAEPVPARVLTPTDVGPGAK
jgi:hypothetical protein